MIRSILRIPLLILILLSLPSTPGRPNASTNTDEFPEILAKAKYLSSLIEPGSQPFHLKLEAAETRHNDPQYLAGIELWWAAPDKWRREVKSLAFSQIAVQNGGHYYESNSSDYLPWWLHELIQESVDPVPLAELKDQDVDFSGKGCANWETEYAKENEKVTVYNRACFNVDGTAKELFTRTISVELGNYQAFGEKRTARVLTVWPGGPADIKGVVTRLEKLKENERLFDAPGGTSVNARMRFLSVPESELQPDGSTGQTMNWPVIHNFPATGAITINVKLDRNGNVREVGTAVSKNVLMVDGAVAQVKSWKFKPYYSEGSPVEVNTNLTLRYEAKVELLGADGATIVAEPFLQRINKARQLSDPRIVGSKPFHLHASYNPKDSGSGTYEEIWQSPTKWRRQAQLGSVTVVESLNGDKFYRKFTGSEYSPRPIDALLDGMDGPFPRTDFSFHEADWGQSAVQLASLDMLRVARGRVDSNNQPISGQAYWFDAAGLLRSAYVQPRTTNYSDFVAWNGKQIPRRVELTEDGLVLMFMTIEQIEAAGEIPDSQFVMEGVKPELVGDAPDDGPPLVQPQPILKVKPLNPSSEHGMVLVDIQMDTHGHVVTATVKQSAGPTLDAAAEQAALQWEFTPMFIKGKRVPGHGTLRFDF
jgi:TonB family protein